MANSNLAGAFIQEVDLSARVASFNGVYAAIVLKSKKGSLSKRESVVNDVQLLKRYTPKETVEVGMDLAFFSALAYLERGNRLWVIRAANGAAYAGLKLVTAASSNANAGIPNSPLITDPTAVTFAVDELLFVYGINEGVHGQGVAVKITPYTLEPNAFTIDVFLTGNTTTPVESFIVSRDQTQKDGYGRNMFVENVLQSSNYIRAFNNPLIPVTTLPKTQSTALFMTGGSDGSAVADSHMVNALNKMINPEETPVTVVMDGGNATNTYHQAINTFCQTRKDCVGILSVPYSAQITSTYLNDIISYRTTTLNMNSSYCALYVPHLKITDRYNDRDIFVSPDGYVAGSISFSSENYEIWYPPAGYKRGVLNVKDVAVKFLDAEMSQLQANGINPIRFTTSDGIVIWGQRTLLSRPSALDRLNVRLMLIVITPALKRFFEGYTFDLVDTSEYVIIRSKVEDYLDNIKGRKGMRDFLVVLDETINTGATLDNLELNCDIYIKPLGASEFINVRLMVTPNALTFEQAKLAV